MKYFGDTQAMDFNTLNEPPGGLPNPTTTLQLQPDPPLGPPNLTAGTFIQLQPDPPGSPPNPTTSTQPQPDHRGGPPNSTTSIQPQPDPPGSLLNSTTAIQLQSEPPGETVNPTPASTFEPEALEENPPYTNETIRAFRFYTQWSYPQLHEVFGISLGSLHRITHSPISSSAGEQASLHQVSLGQTSHQVVHHERGRYSVVTNELCAHLIATATANSHNRRLSYTQVAELAGIRLGQMALRRVFESEGYHRQVARIKPFLSDTARTQRQE